MVSAHCPNIPVPKIYAFDAKGLNPFIAQEYIDGEPLSTIWNRYTQTEKGLVALKIAEIVVDMAEMRFSSIGGFASCIGNFASGPTVEGSKLFKGRVSLRRPLRRSIDLCLDRVNFILIVATLSVHTKLQRRMFSLATTKRYTTIHMHPRPISTSTFSDTHLSKISCNSYEIKGGN
jgi:hypothetical protein